jgi:hypothetical protein
MKTDKEMIQLYESMYNDNMLWFVLGSLISSDSFIGVKGNSLIKQYRTNISTLKRIIKLIPKTNIPVEQKDSILNIAKDSINILMSEHNTIVNDCVNRNIIKKDKYKLYALDI